MNILIIYCVPLDVSRGGTERAIALKKKILEGLGCRVHYCYLCESEGDRKCSEEEGIRVSKFDYKERIIELCKRGNVDIVVNELGEFLDFSFLQYSGVKIISCIHFDVDGMLLSARETQRKNPFQYLKHIYRRYMQGKHIYKIIRANALVSDMVLVPSLHIEEKLKRKIKKLKSKFITVPHPNPYGCVNMRDSLEKKEKILFYVGRLNKDKGVDILIDAWRILSVDLVEWKLCIAGHGELEEELKETVKRDNIKGVEFCGKLDEPSLLYKKGRYALMASFHESFSFYALESLSHGAYLIARDIPALAQFVPPGAKWGTLMKDLSASTLSKVIRYHIENCICNDEQSMIDAMYYLKKYDIDTVSLIWKRLIDKCMNKVDSNLS